jgi:cation:H+ antiporter
MIQGLIFILGLIGLWLGTKWVVKSALGMADRFNLSHAFVGLAILAVGTDLPEVFVTIDAAFLQLKGVESSGIITGNAIGSSISQISIILGLAGLLLNFKIAKKELVHNGIALFTSIALLFAVGFDGIISRIDGLILLSAYVIHYVVLLKNSSSSANDHIPQQHHSNLMLAGYLLIGFVMLIFSSHFVVKNAMYFAERWGVAQSFVGIVLIGLGTSLPELAVSIGAAMKKSAEMSVGNIIGSNIFDTLVPIGLGGSITQISMENNLLKFDLPVQFVITLLVVIFLATKRGILRIEAIALIIIYLLYVLAKLFLFEGKL